MATETERKFLITSDSWKKDVDGLDLIGTPYKQAYLTSSKERTVRVRIAGNKGFITIKGSLPEGGLTRLEYEYEIPVVDAAELIENVCLPERIEKTRYTVHFGGHIWEIDVFHGANEGLIMAEVELEHEHEPVELPPWIGEEVTHDSRYYNGRLAQEPFSHWK